MMITHHTDKASKTVFVTAVGDISVPALIEHEKKVVADPEFQTGFNTLADFTHARPATGTGYDAVALARDFLKSIQDLRGRCKWAFIAPGDIAYGVCRMFVTMAEGLSVESAVFRTEAEARSWLNFS
jgi:hypothetical protein